MKIKQTLSVILALALAFSVGVTAFAKVAGDVTGDGKVNSTDALCVLRYSVGTVKEIDKNVADMNNDGKINSTDALAILRISAGLTDNAIYKAAFTLNAKVGTKTYSSGETIPVKVGDSVYVTLSLSTNYYTGPTSAQLYYNNKVFASAPSAKFNTDGRLYKASGKQFCTFVDWDKIAQANKETCWPDYSEAKLAEFKKNHKFLRITMTPNITQTSTAPKSINEELVTVEFKVNSSVAKGTTGQIIIPIESRRTKNYLNGHLMCSVHPSEDITVAASPYVDGLAYDCSKAVLNFKVS